MSLVVTTPTDREIVLTRAFKAPRQLVFDALTKPDLVKRWLGARGWDVCEAEIDLRVGGRWRFVSRGPGDAVMGHGGVYREVDPPDRLVYTESYDSQWFPGEHLVTVELSEDDGDTNATNATTTTITTMTTTLLYPSREIRDIVVRSPMKRGVSEGYERLDRVLEDQMERS